jgi:hypothetical protein
MPQHSTQRRSVGLGEVAQRPSTDDHNAQLELLSPAQKKPSSPVEIAHLRSIPSLKRAVAYSLHLADMDPKEAYLPLQMDKATWSRIINGNQEVPATIFKPLRLLTGNRAPLMWAAFDDGCELVPLKSDLEQQLEQERAARAEAERENELLRKLILERR